MTLWLGAIAVMTVLGQPMVPLVDGVGCWFDFGVDVSDHCAVQNAPLTMPGQAGDRGDRPLDIRKRRATDVHSSSLKPGRV